MSPFNLVTVARQFGAGGAELAVALGRSLGWPVLDRDIIRTSAERLHTDEAHAKSVDEYAAGALQQLLAEFAHALPEYMVEPAYEVDPDELARVEHDLIRSAAKSSPLVVVGHGCQCILAARPGTLHVRVVAPFDTRVRRVAERDRADSEAASAEVHRRDVERARYLRHHFNADNNDPGLYSMQLNLATISVVEACGAITELVRGRSTI